MRLRFNHYHYRKDGMERVNANAGTLPETDIKITDFWQTVCLPHIERNTKASTIHGYKKIWQGHLSVAFAGLNLTEYPMTQRGS